MFRWKGGEVIEAPGYIWTAQPIGNPPYANGAIYVNTETGVIWPQYYRAATVFYTNHFSKFLTVRGDANMGNMSMSDWEPDHWQRLAFDHGHNNLSLVQHAAEHDFLAVREASWIEQLLPRTYRRKDYSGRASGRRSAGLLPIIIALVAFSCTGRRELRRILIEDRA